MMSKDEIELASRRLSEQTIERVEKTIKRKYGIYIAAFLSVAGIFGYRGYTNFSEITRQVDLLTDNLNGLTKQTDQLENDITGLSVRLTTSSAALDRNIADVQDATQRLASIRDQVRQANSELGELTERQFALFVTGMDGLKTSDQFDAVSFFNALRDFAQEKQLNYIQVSALIELADAYARQNIAQSARQKLKEAEELAGASDEVGAAALVELLIRRSKIEADLLNSTAEARITLQRALKQAERSGDPYQLALVYKEIGDLLHKYETGNADLIASVANYRKYIATLKDIASDQRIQGEVAGGLRALGLTLALLSERNRSNPEWQDEATRTLKEASLYALAVAQRENQVTALGRLAEIQYLQGNVDEATRTICSAAKIASQWARGEPTIKTFLVWVETKGGGNAPQITCNA